MRGLRAPPSAPSTMYWPGTGCSALRNSPASAVPEEYYRIPLGQAATVREGGDVTITEYQSINVEALHTDSSPRYAQPVPEPTDGSN